MSKMEASVAWDNVFTPEYLQVLAREDEPARAAEGELAGPSPWALALLLQAAGPGVQREVGEILFRGVVPPTRTDTD